MAVYTITLTSGEDSILQAVASLKSLTPQALVTSVAKEALTSQALQFLEEEGKNKVTNMTASQKVTFLNS